MNESPVFEVIHGAHSRCSSYLQILLMKPQRGRGISLGPLPL